jgi:hypothetical protein
MATSSTQKSCARGNDCKQSAVITCEGWSTAFCMKHMNDHRRLLDEKIKPIISQCDSLKKVLNGQTTEPDINILLKKIDNWEKQSIAKIQQEAKKCRQRLRQPNTVLMSDSSKKLQELSEQLKKSREDLNFIETDLKHWQQQLKDLEAELTTPPKVYMNQHNNDSLLASIFVNVFKIATDSFERVSDTSVQIEEDGKVAVHDGSAHCTEIRGKNEYNSGCHEIRLRIEQLSNSWMFLGINSKSTLIQNESYNLKSTYGWSKDNCIWSNGKYKRNELKPYIEIQNNDTITLLFDCDNHTIAMINRRTNAEHAMTVDVLQCPLPWQIHVILCEPGSRVRLLTK